MDNLKVRLAVGGKLRGRSDNRLATLRSRNRRHHGGALGKPAARQKVPTDVIDPVGHPGLAQLVERFEVGGLEVLGQGAADPIR